MEVEMPRKYTEEEFWNRFWDQVHKTDGCWNWTGLCMKAGYGEIWRHGTMVYTHRLSYEFHYGPISPGNLVCHKCDNRPCVNPDHLFLGSYRDNAQDMLAKGRGNPRRGEMANHAKLSASQVIEIREAYLSGKNTQVELAKIFGIHKRNIWMIISRKVWKHI